MHVKLPLHAIVPVGFVADAPVPHMLNSHKIPKKEKLPYFLVFLEKRSGRLPFFLGAVPHNVKGW